MRLIKFALPALVLVGGLTLTTMNSYGKAEYMKATKKACAVCHTTKPPAKDGKDLTAVGKCYKEKKSIEACEDKK